MIKLYSRSSATLLGLLLIFTSYHSLAQKNPGEEILQWENEIAVFDSLNLLEPSDENTLLVTGSSSVRLWESIHTDLEPYQVMQRGYGGAKLTDYNYYAERIIKAHSFKAIVVFVANDIAGVESDFTPKEVKKLFQKLVKQVRRRNPDTPVCWVEITPTPKRWHVYQSIREANDLIRQYCDYNSDLYFISTYDYFVTSEGLPNQAYFREDGLHMNSDGYQLWARIIKSCLKEFGINP